MGLVVVAESVMPKLSEKLQKDVLQSPPCILRSIYALQLYLVYKPKYENIFLLLLLEQEEVKVQPVRIILKLHFPRKTGQEGQ